MCEETLMAKKKSMSLFQTVADVLESEPAPVPVDEITERVLKRYPSQSKNPAARIRSHLRTDHVGRTLVFLDRKTVRSTALNLFSGNALTYGTV
jgi:hypothetical protein